MISRKRMLAATAAAALVAVTAAGCASSSAGTKSTSDGSPGLVMINTSKYDGNLIPATAKPVGTLTDDAGKPFNIRTMTKGTVTLLFFGYTHCPDECPLTMANTAAALRMMPAAEAAKVKVLFVSVDPGRDTLARLRSWLGNFYPSFIGLRAPLSRGRGPRAAARPPDRRDVQGRRGRGPARPRDRDVRLQHGQRGHRGVLPEHSARGYGA